MTKTQFTEIFLKERDRMMESIENSYGPEDHFFIKTSKKIDNCSSDELKIVLAAIEDDDSLEDVYNKANGELNDDEMVLLIDILLVLNVSHHIKLNLEKGE